ncbi:MAG: four helix bundle protein [Dehalococcoidia bacterium]|nr:four helix bundle protein [Dehalococcoidia bacterium]
MSSPERGPKQRVRHYSDLVAWQKARVVHADIWRATAVDRFRQDLDLQRQMRRAARSVMANIAEGFDRTGSGEFAHFLSIAKGSSAELESHLYGSIDIGLLPEGQATTLLEQVREVNRILAGLRSSISRKQTEG